MRDDDGRAGFDAYRESLLHFARFAKVEPIEMFRTGLEYAAATRGRPGDGRAMGRDVSRDRPPVLVGPCFGRAALMIDAWCEKMAAS